MWEEKHPFLTIVNGINVGKKINNVPILLYGVVDVFGRAGGVTITGMFEYNMFS